MLKGFIRVHSKISPQFPNVSGVYKSPIKDRSEQREPDLRLDKLLKNVSLCSDLNYLMDYDAKRFVDHAIEVEKRSKPPRRRLHQFSPAEKKQLENI